LNIEICLFWKSKYVYLGNPKYVYLGNPKYVYLGNTYEREFPCIQTQSADLDNNTISVKTLGKAKQNKHDLFAQFYYC